MRGVVFVFNMCGTNQSTLECSYFSPPFPSALLMLLFLTVGALAKRRMSSVPDDDWDFPSMFMNILRSFVRGLGLSCG